MINAYRAVSGRMVDSERVAVTVQRLVVDCSIRLADLASACRGRRCGSDCRETAISITPSRREQDVSVEGKAIANGCEVALKAERERRLDLT